MYPRVHFCVFYYLLLCRKVSSFLSFKMVFELRQDVVQAVQLASMSIVPRLNSSNPFSSSTRFVIIAPLKMIGRRDSAPIIRYICDSAAFAASVIVTSVIL